jgi:DNA-binding transcriptional MerR regulator
MAYTIKQLANLSGVTVRTLHHYDQIGLLKTPTNPKNGYRQYGEPELLRLQQILFFRELDFPLDEIQRILDRPTFNLVDALTEQRRLIGLKKNRLTKLLTTIDKTIKKINHEITMNDEELYDVLKDPDAAQYADEAKARWGNTDAYKQSQERVGKMTKAQMAKLKEDADAWMKVFASEMHFGPTSPEIQKRITEHYNSLRTFYEPNLELYRGLAEMYVTDPRFAAYYEKYAPGLAKFMRDAMIYFCDQQPA